MTTILGISETEPASTASGVFFDKSERIEVSVVMPCLNEADTVATCIEKAQRALRENDITGEVIIADNGSSDGSQEIAKRLGARVVQVAHKGYGSALRGGIATARGKFVLMGDADDSYDFLELPKFVAKLREGRELVQGCRLPVGGGRIMPGAMPLSHRWLGNPMFSLLVRRMFWAPIHDVYCGMRGFEKELYDRLNLSSVGMEFATEMIIKASVFRVDIAEVPITLYPDGRKSHPPHLRTLRDGWRTLRFFLLYCPRWLFWYPGLTLMLLGILGYVAVLPGLSIHGVVFDAHTLLFASLAILLGYQSAVFAVLAKTYAVGAGLLPKDARLNRFFHVATLERGLLVGLAGLAAGAVLLGGAVNQWRLADFGPLNYAQTMRWVIPGVTLTALGFQTVLMTFLANMLGIPPR